MIKIIEKEFLDDNFIIKPFASNIKISENIYFKKDDTYYFGNYKKDKLNYIKEKINKNKKRIISAIENGTTIIIHGNSIELFNNSFKACNINLFTAYSTDFSVKVLPLAKKIKRYTIFDKLPELSEKGRIAIFVGSHNDFSEREINAIENFCSSRIQLRK